MKKGYLSPLSASGLTWLLQEIGNDQEIMQKCLQEVEEIFGESDRNASVEDLNKMKVSFETKTIK